MPRSGHVEFVIRFRGGDFESWKAAFEKHEPQRIRHGAVGHWIEKGRLVHPVHEVTIAGNLQQMLLDVDAMGSDLVWRSSSAAPTLRIRRMTVSGS